MSEEDLKHKRYGKVTKPIDDILRKYNIDIKIRSEIKNEIEMKNIMPVSNQGIDFFEALLDIVRVIKDDLQAARYSDGEIQMFLSQSNDKNSEVFIEFTKKIAYLTNEEIKIIEETKWLSKSKKQFLINKLDLLKITTKAIIVANKNSSYNTETLSGNCFTLNNVTSSEIYQIQDKTIQEIIDLSNQYLTKEKRSIENRFLLSQLSYNLTEIVKDALKIIVKYLFWFKSH